MLFYYTLFWFYSILILFYSIPCCSMLFSSTLFYYSILWTLQKLQTFPKSTTPLPADGVCITNPALSPGTKVAVVFTMRPDKTPAPASVKQKHPSSPFVNTSWSHCRCVSLPKFATEPPNKFNWTVRRTPRPPSTMAPTSRWIRKSSCALLLYWDDGRMI